MKVAITCDYIITRNHYLEIIETICEIFPDSRIYTFAHCAGAILGKVEQRRITSTHLSKSVKTEFEFYQHSAQLPLLAKNLFVSCEYDLIINVSMGLSHGLKKCDKSKQLTYLYDLGFEGKVKKTLLQKLTYPWFLNFFVKSFKQADYIWVSRESLKQDLSKYIGNAVVVAPPFKISDYTLFPKDMFKHHFYLIDSSSLSSLQVRELMKFFDQTKREYQFIGEDGHLEAIKAEFSKIRPNLFFGIRCAGEHAPVMASSKMYITFNDAVFPKYTLATLATGRPVLILDSMSSWVSGTGIFTIKEFNIEALEARLNEFEKIEDSFVGPNLRAHVNEYHETKFKTTLKRFIEKEFQVKL